MLFSLTIGSVALPLVTVLDTLTQPPWLSSTPPTIEQSILWLIRVPRILVAALVGAALAMAGAQMQGLLQNPLASPGIIGTSSGAALGAVFALVTGLASLSLFYLPLFAFIGAFCALFTVYALASWRGTTPMATLLLAGIAVNAFIAACTSFIITFVWQDYEVAGQIVFWLLGSLESRTWAHVGLISPGLLLGSLLAILYSRELDILLAGQETAHSLGVAVERVKRIVLTGTALLTASAVAVSGMIGFVGLIIPHIVRLLIGPQHRYLIPASGLTGAIFLVLMDTLARTVHAPQEMRIGILTALIGAPFFLFLLIRERRKMG
jgi:iron complex transport system permease protein